MVCMFVERVYCFYVCIYLFISVSGLECLSLGAVSSSVERSCFLLVADCMYIYIYIKHFKKIVSLYFCTNCPSVLFDTVQRRELILGNSAI